MKNYKIKVFTLFLFFAMLALAKAEEKVNYDWPQWRGINRDGIAPASPKLLDKWPEKGPKLLWKSKVEIPSGREGGCGSVTVSNGKAFLFAHFNARVLKVGITTKELKAWGWMSDLPEDLIKKVEAERIIFFKKYWGRTPPEKEIAKQVTSFISTLDSAVGKKYEVFIKGRFQKGKETGKFAWKTLRDLATIKDKEFASIAELGKNIKYVGWGNLFHPHSPNGAVVKSFILKKCFGWTDNIFCFDANTGKLLWKKKFPGNAASSATYYYAASSTPAIDDGKCYVTGSAGLYCLSVKDGSVKWKVKNNYSNSSPLILNGVLYGMFGRNLQAYNGRNGKLLWTQLKLKGSSRGSNSSVVPWTHGGKNYLIGISGHNIFCASQKNGKLLWNVFFSKGANDCTPVISGDILVARSYTGLGAYKLTLKKPERLWSAKGRCGDRGSTPLIYQKHVYIVGSMYGIKSAVCLDIATGNIKWKHGFKKMESTSPIAVDGKIIVHVKNPKGKKQYITVMYKASSEKFEQLGMLTDAAGPFSSPTVANGKLYLRLEKGVACYELQAK